MDCLIKALTCAVVMFTVAATAHAEASYPETVRLVRSMRSDELVVVALHASLARDTGTGKWTKDEAACLSKVKYPLFTDAVALSLAPKLTDAEVADAIEFYRSDVGRKVTEQTYEDLKNNVEGDVFRGLNEQELRVVAKFFKRSAGPKVEDIVGQSDMQQRVAARVRIALADCEYDASDQSKAWASSPVRAPNGECTAMKQIVDFAHADIGIETRIQVSCPGFGHAFTLAQFKGRIEGVGFRWLNGNTIEVIHPAGTAPSRRFEAKRFKAAYRQRTAADPAPPQCWPQWQGNPSLRVELNELASQPFWMNYVDGEQCLLSKRIEQSQIPGADGAKIVQFVKRSSPEYPFGTTELVLFETVSGSGAKSAVIRGAGLELPMTPGSGFHLRGRAAESVLRALPGGRLKLEITPASGSVFSVDLAPTDLPWALPPFERCISGSGAAAGK